MTRTGSARDRRRRLGATAAAVALAGGLALAGCGAAGSEARSASAGGAPAMPQNGAVAKGAVGGGAAAAGTPNGVTGNGGGKVGAKLAPTAPTGRAIIYTGEIQLRTDGGNGAGGVDAAVARAEQLVSAAGGFIDSEVSGSDGYLSYPYNQQDGGTAATGSGGPVAQPLPQPSAVGGESAQLVLRVPVDSYDGVYRQLLKLGTVLAHQRQAQDVTQQVVDVSSRVKTQQASVDRVRALMDKAQNISDVTALEQDLTQRQSDLESLESQLAALQSQTAMSTVTVQFYAQAAPAPAPTPPPKGGLSVFGALKGGWHALYETVRGLLIALAAALPFLVPLAALAWLVRLLQRRGPDRRRLGRPVPVAAAATGPEPGPEPERAPESDPEPAPED